MGTTYHVKVVTHCFKSPEKLQAKIEKRLADINQSMSTYIPTSEISNFNNGTDIVNAHAVSSDFHFVMAQSQQLNRLTHGAWDGTVKPLVDLWGFGPPHKPFTLPDPQQITKLLKQVGFSQIEIKADGSLRKKSPQITVDLASIAKGYAVDQISNEIKKSGFTDFIVEIGGEVYASGLRPGNKAWRVGINTPSPEAGYDMVYKAVSLTDKAMATSGDYRNFFEINGVRYSHIIDPRTGYPVKNGVVSVSVMSNSCIFADGMATALMVMGPKEGIELINRIDETECLIIVENHDGSFTNHYSKNFPQS